MFIVDSPSGLQWLSPASSSLTRRGSCCRTRRVRTADQGTHPIHRTRSLPSSRLSAWFHLSPSQLPNVRFCYRTSISQQLLLFNDLLNKITQQTKSIATILESSTYHHLGDEFNLSLIKDYILRYRRTDTTICRVLARITSISTLSSILPSTTTSSLLLLQYHHQEHQRLPSQALSQPLSLLPPPQPPRA